MAKTKGKSTAKAAPQTAAHDTLIGVILDRSGSMESCRAATISGFNEFLKGQRATQNGAQVLMSLAQFDLANGSPPVDFNFEGASIEKVPDLSTESYVPRGSTPLHDAIVTSIGRFEQWVAAQKWAGKVLCLIITDGEENASREATLDTVKALITKKETTDQWNFMYLGANQNAFAVGSAMGLHSGSVSNYNATPQGTRRAFLSASMNTTAYRGSATRGGIAGQSMFSAGRPDDVDQDITTMTAVPQAGSGRMAVASGSPAAQTASSGRLQPQ